MCCRVNAEPSHAIKNSNACPSTRPSCGFFYWPHCVLTVCGVSRHMSSQLLLPAVRSDWNPLPNTALGVFVSVPACAVLKSDHSLHCAAHLCYTSTKDFHLLLVWGNGPSRDCGVLLKDLLVLFGPLCQRRRVHHMKQTCTHWRFLFVRWSTNHTQCYFPHGSVTTL